MTIELQELKDKAKILGIAHSPNIGEDALLAKIAEAMAKDDKQVEEVSVEEVNKWQKAYAEAMKLVRVEILPSQPEKVGQAGDEFAVMSKYLGYVYRYVPFGKPYHIPQCLLNIIKDKVYTMRVKDGGVNEEPVVATPRMYSIEYLDPLTPEEVEKINFDNKRAGL